MFFNIEDMDTQVYAESLQLKDLNDLSFTDDLSLNQSSSSASSPTDTSAQTSPVAEKSLEMLPFESEPIVEQLEETVMMEPVPQEDMKRRRSSSSDESSDSSSGEEESESEEEEEAIVIPTTVANMNSRVVYSSDSESDSEIMPRVSSPSSPYMYMHKRQIEETLLDRITNHLQPHKLPGILPILSSVNSRRQQEDEIEIDLSCVAREQLVQVLLYVDACLLEQEGGPAVNVEDFVQKKKPRTRPSLQNKTRAEEMDSSDEQPTGPISMASLSKGRRAPRKRTKRREDDDVVTSVAQDPHSIASSRPKRRSALHKRRLLEEMLAPSSDEEEEDEDTQIVVFGDEKMDLNIMGNETIVHQATVIAVDTAPVIEDVNENTDEEIDIMF